MAKQILKFNNIEYTIDDSVLAPATARLEAHLMSMMDAPDEERLEGDGAEYYTLAPTALSFRSTAPLNELQEVQINGVTVDPANYTLEEGSTIVTFPIEYLKTLEKGNYEVDIVSTSKSVKGGFTVSAPELNEYGFYYNQPYSAEVSGWGKVVFFIREDGTYDLINGYGVTSTNTYTVDGNSIVALDDNFGAFHCTVSSDGTEIYCAEVQTALKLSNDTSIAADEDYIYRYNEELGGYEVTAIDKTKAEYGDIKTGINDIDTVKLGDGMFQYLAVSADGAVVAKEHYINPLPEIPNSVTIIGEEAFENCHGFTNIKLHMGVTSIGQNAFSTSLSLTSIEIPDSVTSIGGWAFWMCMELVTIKFDGTIAQWNAITLGDNWNLNIPATHVHCSDGDVAL